MTELIEPELNIKVIRTNRRKTASIKIVLGMIQVTIPKKLSEKRLRELIAKSTPWIRKKLRLHGDTTPIREKKYVSGESFFYLGRNYHLKLIQGNSIGIKLKGGNLVLNINNNEPNWYIKEQLVQWYFRHADQQLKDKTIRYGEIVEVEPKSISLKNYKSRWGSCTVSGDISYNWKIIIAPHHIIDYVVVHELCHIHEHNHSPAFWKLVSRVIPDYKDCREWLKVNGSKLIV
jgi:predicted metal-dependent hydrolase